MSQQDRGRHTLRGAVLLLAAIGVGDGLFAALTSNLGSGAARGAAAVMSMGLWIVAGAVFTGIVLIAFRAARGANGWTSVRHAALSHLHAAWVDRGTEEDRERAARLVAAVVALAGWLAASIGLLSHLIATRHGAVLIAVTFVAVQFAIAAATALSFAVVHRGVRRVLQASFVANTAVRHVVSTPALALMLVVVVAIGSAAILYWQREVWVAVSGSTWALLAFGLAIGPLLGPTIGRRVRVSVVSVALISVAALLVLGTAQVPAARLVVANDTISARVLLSALQVASDFDGDGSPLLPAFDDCGPFDPDIGPLASETSGDDIDANCDGEVDAPDPSTFRWDARGEAAIPKGKPDLVLITIDSWRADTTGFSGVPGVDSVMPHLDAFAADAVVFQNAWSQDSGTGPSLWSLTAGKTPFQTKIDSSGRFPPSFLPQERTLAERLKDVGYHTNALLCGYVFATKHWNLNRGFDVYKEVCGRKKAKQAVGTIKRALTVIRTQREEPGPFFLWVHIYDPHRPYHDHPDQKRGSDPKAHYLEEVHYTDNALKPLLDELRASERRTVVAITADHGENFDEHGSAAHARNLYREVTHVPLVFWGSDASAATWGTPVAVNDIHPTFLELAGAPTDHSTMTSQAPVLYGATPSPDRLVFQENSFSRPRRHVKAVIGRGHHLIYDTTNDAWELYDLEADRAQKNGLQNTGLPVEAELRAALRAFIPTTKIPEKLAR